jgi:hypothetical protein
VGGFFSSAPTGGGNRTRVRVGLRRDFAEQRSTPEKRLSACKRSGLRGFSSRIAANCERPCSWKRKGSPIRLPIGKSLGDFLPCASALLLKSPLVISSQKPSLKHELWGAQVEFVCKWGI